MVDEYLQRRRQEHAEDGIRGKSWDMPFVLVLDLLGVFGGLGKGFRGRKRHREMEWDAGGRMGTHLSSEERASEKDTPIRRNKSKLMTAGPNLELDFGN